VRREEEERPDCLKEVNLDGNGVHIVDPMVVSHPGDLCNSVNLLILDHADSNSEDRRRERGEKKRVLFLQLLKSDSVSPHLT